jgi:hypothetical protein
MIPTEPRYCGTFELDGQERFFSIEASSHEDVENRLLSLYPGRSIAVKECRMAGGIEL